MAPLLKAALLQYLSDMLPLKIQTDHLIRWLRHLPGAHSYQDFPDEQPTDLKKLHAQKPLPDGGQSMVACPSQSFIGPAEVAPLTFA